MRKFISLGLFALVLTSLSAQLSAGHFEDCEDEFKAIFQEVGAYGLCNAWHNAETDEDRTKFALLFEKKAGFPPPWIADCPCFSVNDLAFAGGFDPVNCTMEEDVAGAVYDQVGPTKFNLIYGVAASGTCFLSNKTGITSSPSGAFKFIDPEQVQACFDLLEGLILEDFPGGCSS
ncbi:hypothetical protein ACFL33_02500 [Pseudomonadota bacterium]